MNKFFSCLASVLVAIVLAFVPLAAALAHQDGCHKWHSCPSDTGSYICGDLGYTSGCPKTSTPKVAPESTSREMKAKVKVPAKAKAVKPAAQKVFVEGYYKKNGTYVKGYWRSK